jgi:putative (di)nucleoside polyphosphate hydrolase
MTDFGRDGYRHGVGIVLLNEKSKVFVGLRIGMENAWQMPQGGMKTGETVEQAARRELKEEIGTDRADLIGASKEWFRYEVPSEFIPKSWNGQWHGQAQKWIVMLFRGNDDDINLATEEPEFSAWRWVDVSELIDLAVPFKRELYERIIGEFPHIFRD